GAGSTRGADAPSELDGARRRWCCPQVASYGPAGGLPHPSQADGDRRPPARWPARRSAFWRAHVREAQSPVGEAASSSATERPSASGTVPLGRAYFYGSIRGSALAPPEVAEIGPHAGGAEPSPHRRLKSLEAAPPGLISRRRNSTAADFPLRRRDREARRKSRDST